MKILFSSFFLSLGSLVPLFHPHFKSAASKEHSVYSPAAIMSSSVEIHYTEQKSKSYSVEVRHKLAITQRLRGQTGSEGMRTELTRTHLNSLCHGTCFLLSARSYSFSFLVLCCVHYGCVGFFAYFLM